MEGYFAVWTFVMFAFDVLVTIFGFGFMQRSLNRMTDILDRIDQRSERQEVAWQRLFAKADNTERLTQEILTRLADERTAH